MYKFTLLPAMENVPLAPHPHQHVPCLEFLILVILMGVKCDLKIVLISPMTKDFEHLSISWPFEDSLFLSIPHFLIGLFGLLVSKN